MLLVRPMRRLEKLFHRLHSTEFFNVRIWLTNRFMRYRPEDVVNVGAIMDANKEEDGTWSSLCDCLEAVHGPHCFSDISVTEAQFLPYPIDDIGNSRNVFYAKFHPDKAPAVKDSISTATSDRLLRLLVRVWKTYSTELGSFLINRHWLFAFYSLCARDRVANVDELMEKTKDMPKLFQTLQLKYGPSRIPSPYVAADLVARRFAACTPSVASQARRCFASVQKYRGGPCNPHDDSDSVQ